MLWLVCHVCERRVYHTRVYTHDTHDRVCRLDRTHERRVHHTHDTSLYHTWSQYETSLSHTWHESITHMTRVYHTHDTSRDHIVTRYTSRYTSRSLVSCMCLVSIHESVSCMIDSCIESHTWDETHVTRYVTYMSRDTYMRRGIDSCNESHIG